MQILDGEDDRLPRRHLHHELSQDLLREIYGAEYQRLCAENAPT